MHIMAQLVHIIKVVEIVPCVMIIIITLQILKYRRVYKKFVFKNVCGGNQKMLYIKNVGF
jgi:hypothetical protein